MPAPDLEIDLLRSFVAVAEAGSFTAAAPVVGRTQSAVSQKILKLEEILGRRVFERSSRSLALTRDGELLLEAARRMLEFNDRTIHHFRAPVVTGILRLGVADDFLPHQLPRLLARFARDYPGIRLDLKTGMSCALLAEMDAGGLDLALAKRDGTVRGGRVVWREPMVWIAAEGVDLPSEGPVPLVLLPPPCTYRGLALETLAGAGRAVHIACTASSLMGVQAAVAGGLGISVLGQSFVQPGLRILSTPNGWPPLPMTEIILLGEERTQSPLAAPLVAFLTDSLAVPRVQAAGL